MGDAQMGEMLEARFPADGAGDLREQAGANLREGGGRSTEKV